MQSRLQNDSSFSELINGCPCASGRLLPSTFTDWLPQLKHLGPSHREAVAMCFGELGVVGSSTSSSRIELSDAIVASERVVSVLALALFVELLAAQLEAEEVCGSLSCGGGSQNKSSVSERLIGRPGSSSSSLPHLKGSHRQDQLRERARLGGVLAAAAMSTPQERAACGELARAPGKAEFLYG